MALIDSIVVTYIEIDGCNDIRLNTRTFQFSFYTLLLSWYYTFNPQRLVRLHLVGEYVPILPLGFWVFVPDGAH